MDDLRKNLSGIPVEQGVYIVVYDGDGISEFLESGSGREKALEWKKSRTGQFPSLRIIG